MTMVPIRVNLDALRRQPFHPCTTTFIDTTCQARCCRSTTDPTGIAVTVTPDEVPVMLRRGADVTTDRRLVPVNRRCPFQHPTTHLCNLHHTGDKPLGCWVSPFTVNTNGTLIVRNRYRLLPCFKAAGAIPIVEAHPTSLLMIFGPTNTNALLRAYYDGHDTITLDAPASVIAALHHKNEASKTK